MLTFQSVVKQFQRVRAVDDLSFEVGEGEIFALLGPNGAGKTTTVRMIMQIMQPDSGSITFSPSIMKEGRVNRSCLGYLPEEWGLYQDAPLMKTLVYLATLRGSDPEAIRVRAVEWLERFGLADRQHEKITTLSKGNQQKVQFIASILHEPRFAVLDEPFSGFDPINQELILEVIGELRDRGMTILLSAHQMQLVEKIADRILMIGDGRELVSGTLAEIRGNGGGQKLVVQYAGAVNDAAFEDSPHILSRKETGEGTLELLLAEVTSLNGVLPLLGKAGTVTGVQTSEVSLHEIFIERFRKDGGQHE